jgi:hypothetical protein
MRRSVLVLFLLLKTSTAWSGDLCPVTLIIPKEWESKHTNIQKGICQVDVSPQDWSQQVAKSRWAEDAVAVRLIVFSVSYREALVRMGFERARDGRYYIEGRQSERDYARKISIGEFTGIRSEPWFRGFAKSDADIAENERIYSGERVVMLLSKNDGLLVGVEYNRSSPDITTDRERVATELLKSIKATPNKAL